MVGAIEKKLPKSGGLRRPRACTKSRGVATVECVVCLPILIAITFATIDLCSAMFLKESLTIAAYEGARLGIQKGGTDSEVRDRIQEILRARKVVAEPDSIVISSPGFDTADTLEHVTVTVQVDCESNLPLTGVIFAGRVINAQVTLRKEFKNN